MSLTAAGLTKRYGRLTALERVSLSIRDGEVLGLIGPNGAGKTTLFECLAGLLPADAGTVSVNGSAVDANERGRHLFYLPDAITPWPAQTVRWALDFSLRFFAGVGRRRDEVVERLDLSAILDATIGTLSKGHASGPCSPSAF
jgi:ABC-2 type transport system ATP-binding protein